MKDKFMYNFKYKKFCLILLIHTLICIKLSTNICYSSNIYLNANEKLSNFPVSLFESTTEIDIGPYIKYYEDKNSKLSINDIYNKDILKDFVQSNDKVLNFGFTNSSYFIKFDLIYKSKKDNIKKDWFLVLSAPLIDLIELYVIDSSGKISTSIEGDHIEFYKRKHPHNFFIFSITTRPLEKLSIFMRIKSESSLKIPLTIYSIEHFYQKDHHVQYIMGIYYGIMLVMIFYNLFLYITIFDKSLLLNIFFIISFTLFQLSIHGKGYEYLWPYSPLFNNIAVPFFISLSCLTSLIFSKYFLNTKVNAILLNKAINILFVISIILSVASFIIKNVYSIKLLSILSILISLIIFCTGVICIKKGYRPARFFMIAWSILLLSTGIYAFKSFGFLGSNFFTEYSISIGFALLIVLFSLSLADRINIERIQTQKAHDHITKIRKDAQIAQDQTRIILEKKANEMVEVADMLTDNANDMSIKAANVAGASEEMTVNLSAIATSIEQMSTNVNNVSKTAKMMSENMSSVAEAIELVFASMNEVRQNSFQGSNISETAMKMADAAGNTIKSFGEAADEIGIVTEVIKRIAEKTEVLAVNAAIEAASAGESGKGFSVVANEISKFAEQSSRAAEDIASKISGVQKNTEDVINEILNVSKIIKDMHVSTKTITLAVDEQTSAIKDIASNTSLVNTYAEEISISMEELSAGGNEISLNANEAASGSNEVAQNIRGVSQSAEEVKKSSNKVNYTAGELKSLASSFNKQ